MKRSEVNSAIRVALKALDGICFHLPPFAHWTVQQMRQAGLECDRVRRNRLGWDVTDFGRDDFGCLGGVLFTIRNGNHADPDQGTPYTEKIIVLTPGQRMPLHFHWSKTEDIINRGGGIMVVELFNSLPDGALDTQSAVTVFCDGCERQVGPGEHVVFGPGESITMTAGTYHRFWAAEDAGTLVCGEVSTVNDDQTDNCFAEPISRFSEIEEDEAPLHLLCNEYGKD